QVIHINLWSERWPSTCKSCNWTPEIDGGASRTILILMRHPEMVGACGHAAEAGLRCSHGAPWRRRSGIIGNCDCHNRQLRLPVNCGSERPTMNQRGNR